MDIENIPILNPTVDKSQIPPIHQKRIVAFVNHFVSSTCTFLNDFILECENKFIDLERKIQRVEASLIIIESKIASIPGLEQQCDNALKNDDKLNSRDENPPKPETVEETTVQPQPELEVHENDSMPAQGVSASSDVRYRKYFKMIQFGVPPNAVKMKMAAEGYDPNILDAPDKILPDGEPYETTEQ